MDPISSSSSASPRKRSPVVRLAIAMAACAFTAPVFVAILFPFFRQTRIDIRREQARENLRVLARGVLMYAEDADGRFPLTMESAAALQLPIGWYLGTAPTTILRPANPLGGELLGDARLDGAARASLANPSETAMLRDSLAWPEGDAAVALADGRAKFFRFPEVEKMAKRDPFGH